MLTLLQGNGESSTNYTFNDSYGGGRFTLSWDNANGGDFVSGLGYAGNANLYAMQLFDTTV
jgi:hypothetical protein